MIDQLQALKVETAGWNVLVKDKKKNILIESKKSERGLHVMRASGPIDHPPIWVWRAEKNGADRGLWDHTCDASFYIQKEGVNGYVAYNRSKRVMIVEGRDFVVE